MLMDDIKNQPMFSVEKFQRKHFHVAGLPLNPWYVTGFTDGEGAFTYSRSGKAIALYFAIKLNFEDRELLYTIKDFFSVGKIYIGKPAKPGRYSGHTRTYFYYRVSKIRELKRIIEHFDKYPLIGKKLKSYNIWKQMVAAKTKYRKPNRTELEMLAGQLSSLRSRNAVMIKNAENNCDL